MLHLKHIVLLTDGQDGYHGYDDVLQEMRDAGITLSTVAVGTGADSRTLEWLAEEGGGRYYSRMRELRFPDFCSGSVFVFGELSDQ